MFQKTREWPTLDSQSYTMHFRIQKTARVGFIFSDWWDLSVEFEFTVRQSSGGEGEAGKRPFFSVSNIDNFDKW